MDTVIRPLESLVAGGRTIDDAWDHIRRYCGLVGPDGTRETWAFGFYDAIPVGEVVGPVDVVTAAVMHPGLSRANLEFFDREFDTLNAWLAEIPRDVGLADASESLKDQVARVAEIAGDELALVTKVLHRHRPRLVPLVDRHILDRYRRSLPAKTESTHVRVRVLLDRLADDLRTNDNRLRTFADLVALGTGTEPSPIRLLDISIWMEGRS